MDETLDGPGDIVRLPLDHVPQELFEKQRVAGCPFDALSGRFLVCSQKRRSKEGGILLM